MGANKEITAGFAWSFAERILAQLVSFIVSLVLARLVTPDQFGLVSLVMIIINLCNIFVTSGLGTGLIQKKNADEDDFSTIFWVSLVFGCFLYSILFISSPFIQNYFGYENFSTVMRVLGLRLILASINTIQHAYVSRKMIFKKFFFATLIGTVISAFAGIGLALKGFGVWAIVAQYLTNTTIDTLVLGVILDWHPKFIFNRSRIKHFVDYGWKVLGASLIDNLYTNLRSFIIGKRYSRSDLAYYNKGMMFPAIIVTNINSTISRVMFPALSVDQDDKGRLRQKIKRSVQSSSYIISPMLIGLMVVAKPLICLLLTDKWIDSVRYIYLFCLTYVFMPIHELNIQAIKATGHSEVVLKVEIAKKIFGVITIIVSIIIWDSPFSLAISFFAYSLIALIINSYPGKKLYGYGTIEQIKDVFIPLGLSLIMAVVIYTIKYVIKTDVLLIATQVLLGVLIYALLSKIFRINTFYILIDSIKRFTRKQKK